MVPDVGKKARPHRESKKGNQESAIQPKRTEAGEQQ